jgi:DnaJ-class molecular chaperone
MDDREPQPEPCKVCNGEGSLEIPDPQRDDPYYASVVRCDSCNGNGWV